MVLARPIPPAALELDPARSGERESDGVAGRDVSDQAKSDHLAFRLVAGCRGRHAAADSAQQADAGG